MEEARCVCLSMRLHIHDQLCHWRPSTRLLRPLDRVRQDHGRGIAPASLSHPGPWCLQLFLGPNRQLRGDTAGLRCGKRTALLLLCLGCCGTLVHQFVVEQHNLGFCWISNRDPRCSHGERTFLDTFQAPADHPALNLDAYTI